METYRTQCIPFRQDESEFYLFKASAKDLLDISVVTHYNSDENDGYQRPPDRTHFRKIAAYLKDHMPAILPTAILAAISPVQVETTPSGELLLHNQIRIVDGQHRILGLRALQTGYNEAGSEGARRGRSYAAVRIWNSRRCTGTDRKICDRALAARKNPP